MNKRRLRLRPKRKKKSVSLKRRKKDKDYLPKRRRSVAWKLKKPQRRPNEAKAKKERPKKKLQPMNPSKNLKTKD